MNTKIKKMTAEYEKNAAKISELQARQEELEKQRIELENLDIIGLVRSMGMTAEELAAFMQASRGKSGVPAFSQKQEETEHEEI